MRELNRTRWPHKIVIKDRDMPAADVSEMLAWMAERFGAQRDKWISIEHHSQTDVYFCEQRDVIMFRLRWGTK